MAAPASRPDSMAAPPPPALSVVLPVYNAMPYLTVAIRDILRQEVEGGLELICAWDGGDVNAWEFLVEVAQRCGRVEVVDAPAAANVLNATERSE